MIYLNVKILRYFQIRDEKWGFLFEKKNNLNLEITFKVIIKVKSKVAIY